MRTLPPGKEVVLVAVARRLVPPLAAADQAAHDEFLAIVDGALAERPARVRRQLGALLVLVRWLPVLRWGVRFDELSGQRQEAMLRWFQDAPVGLLRKGFWGLKTLVFMGWYGRSGCWPELGYEQDFAGNERLHARDGS